MITQQGVQVLPAHRLQDRLRLWKVVVYADTVEDLAAGILDFDLRVTLVCVTSN